MNFHTALIRSLAASVAIAAALGLAGCETDGVTPISTRALKPLSREMTAELEKKNMPLETPILLRIFKEESELEVWKQDATGYYAHLKTFPICRWSGELGPKIKEGDRQAPEGFYTITPGQMNPNSSYYLAFNLGFPNAYDKANERTGAFLMVHGDCSSRGCYAMTDEQIGEIYALGRESFMGGQKSFQVQAYPFRMTPLNMAKHRNSPHMAFWRMIKQGYDHFEVTRQEPKVDVCEKRYVFDAEGPSSKPISFSPKAKCPVYQVPAEIASAVKEKQDKDERQFASYVSQGTQTVAVRTGTDGGMHPTFLAKLQPSHIFDNNGRIFSAAPTGPRVLGSNVNPPRAAEPETTATTRVASADPSQPIPAPKSSGNMFTSLFRSDSPSQPASSEGTLSKVGKLLGLQRADDVRPPPNPKAKPAPKSAVAAAPKPAVAAARTPTQQAHAQPAPAKPPQQIADAGHAKPQPAAPEPTGALMSGATPVVPAGSFESRWSGFR